MRHLMNPLDFSVDELDRLFDLADRIEADPAKYAHACEGKKLATCFYEPSTPSASSPVMQISAPCATQKRALPWWQPPAPVSL